ncbi:adenylate/guanylate cyclase domain-containing protein [uncultured Eudoraea sp.]|uniref:adenylate/guanylate cyclase domain-containing protein n=1 Tax=uncultured Eudoraea sp. TaxID=1035614 RepID=UPI0026352418|nr:adenylate/guanylate cyclase domain-containing protein [uncultured Eudoraea sp.]
MKEHSTVDNLDRLISIIIYADIVGYSSMMQEDEELALSKLRHFEEVLKLQSKKYDGEIVKAYGDGCLMLFPSAVSAIKCAISIQNNLREEPYVPLRIGIHIGEIVRKGQDIFGDGLNIASRIESMGVANSVLISSDIYFQIKNHPEIKTVKLGDFAFKNFIDSWSILIIQSFRL